MSKSIKEFAEKIAEELVVEYKFSADRAVAVVKAYERLVKVEFRDYTEADRIAATRRVKGPLFGNVVMMTTRAILAEMGLNMSSDYKNKLRGVRILLQQIQGWDGARIQRAISTSHTILLKMVMKGYPADAIVEVLVANEEAGASSIPSSLPTSEPWGSD